MVGRVPNFPELIATRASRPKISENADFALTWDNAGILSREQKIIRLVSLVKNRASEFSKQRSVAPEFIIAPNVQRLELADGVHSPEIAFLEPRPAPKLRSRVQNLHSVFGNFPIAVPIFPHPGKTFRARGHIATVAKLVPRWPHAVFAECKELGVVLPK
jgi:hypothetical protein